MERKLIALLLPGILAFSLVTSLRSAAQEQPPTTLRGVNRPPVYDDRPPVDPRDLQVLRKDLRSQKKQIVAANMDLTDEEAEKFWPLYDRYAADLAKIYDDKMALVLEYFDNYKTMNGDQAESYIRQRASVEQNVTALRLKYVPEFRKVLSGRQAALFFQIEWRLDLLIDLQLAQMPLIDP
jgi:hypothetical protein